MDETVYVILKVLFNFALEVWFIIDPVNTNAYIKFGEICQLVLKLLG